MPLIGGTRRAFDLPPDPRLAAIHRYLDLAMLPASFVPPCAYISPVTRFVQPELFDHDGAAELPPSVLQLPDAPTIAVTLGTTWNGYDYLRVFDHVLAGLRDLPVNIVLAVGPTVDPARFGPQPANVCIEQYIPFSLLFPRCDLVITHGGLNTVVTALRARVPVLVVPLGNDHPQNGARCEALGVGRVVEQAQFTASHVRTVVIEMLRDPRYRARAGDVRQEMRALLPVTDAAALVEAVVLEGVRP